MRAASSEIQASSTSRKQAVDWRIFIAILGLHQIAFAIGRALGYGFHRDELYYLECARQLSLGYVDHSFVTPLLALLSGDQLAGLSMLSGALFAATVMMGARLAQEFGGDHRQQWLAAGLFAGAPGLVAGGSLFGTVVVDQAASAWLALATVALIGRSGDRPVLWLSACFLASLTKPQGVVLVLALAAVVAVTLPQRRRLAVLGLAAGLGGLLPLALWNAQHGFPTLEFARNVRSDADPAPLVLVLAVGMIGVVGLAAVAGAVRRAGTHWTLGVAGFGILVFVLTGGKAYYAMPFAMPLLGWAAAANPATRSWMASAAVAAAAVWLVSLPVLPFSVTAKLPVAVSEVNRERVGWESWVAQIRRRAQEVRTSTVIAANYGQAGAVRWWSPATNVLCGHNQHAFWSAQIREDQAIAVGYSESFLRRFFRDVAPLGQVRLEPDLGQEEQGAPIFRVSGLRRSTDFIRGLRHFD